LVTQLCGDHLDMYLLAVKSFARFVSPCRIVAVDDGTLTSEHKRVLHEHITGIEIIPVAQVDVGGCPRDNTWERLVTCLRRSADSYVVQLDADTLTVSPPEDVLAAIRANESFTISGHTSHIGWASYGHRMTMREAGEARRAELQPNVEPHIQILCETSFADVEGISTLFYYRGCSGFAGFARGAASMATLQGYSVPMEQRLGRRWHEWGTEQVASNLIVANSPSGRVLPYPVNASFSKGMDTSDAAVLHFYGSERFEDGEYVRLGRLVIAELLASVATR